MRLFWILEFSLFKFLENGIRTSGLSDGIEHSNPKLKSTLRGRVNTKDRKLKTRKNEQCIIKRDAKSDLGPVDTRKLRKAVTLKAMMTHLRALQSFADSTIDVNRASGSQGYDKSRDYVAAKARAAGYKVSFQEFVVDYFTLNDPEPTFSMVSPNDKAFSYFSNDNNVSGFSIFEFSGGGTATGKIQAVDLVIPPTDAPSSTSGCEDSDFTTFEQGNVALIQRGGCFFVTKVENAIKAGAIAIIIFNEGQIGRTDVQSFTLGETAIGGEDVPVIFTSYDIGLELHEALKEQDVSVSISVNAQTEKRNTANIIAETKGGSTDSIVIVSAHLDSVRKGPGINDNGSGSSVILETAIQMSKINKVPTNKVKFVWFGGEEIGLLGSYHFIDNYLSEREMGGDETISLLLNFDMVASPNGGRFVSFNNENDNPAGSRALAKLFEDFYDSRGLGWEYEVLDDYIFRTDYLPFYEQDIPGGGIFTGAEALKTAEQVAKYGGLVEVAFDECYHESCDDIENINRKFLKESADAIAHAVMTVVNVDLECFLAENMEDTLSVLQMTKNTEVIQHTRGGEEIS